MLESLISKTVKYPKDHTIVIINHLRGGVGDIKVGLNSNDDIAVLDSDLIWDYDNPLDSDDITVLKVR